MVRILSLLPAPQVEVLVRAAPDELPVVAPELARSLLHCKVPIWAAQDPSATSKQQQQQQAPDPLPGVSAGLSPHAEVQRQRALTAVLSLSPLTVGDTVIAELYSPHLDQYQRMLILDSLAAAAVEMADPRKAPRLAAAAPGEAPKLLPPAAAATKQPTALTASQQQQVLPSSRTAVNGSSQTEQASSAAAAAAPGMVASSSRVWGKVSLAKQQQAQANAQAGLSGPSGQPVRTFRNRFAPVAVRWASLLLQECDVRKHGVDLFGRDSLLLGRLLTVLGAFVEAAAATPAALPLSAGLLELVKAPQVSGHKEVRGLVFGVESICSAVCRCSLCSGPWLGTGHCGSL
jgi:telomere length regulation protein